MNIKVTLDKSDKWLDKRRKMTDPDGWKRDIDAFYVLGMSGGKSVDVMFCKAAFEEGYYKLIRYFKQRKKVTYTDGKMIITICGIKYQVGNYEEV
jgi:hypothetical protein